MPKNRLVESDKLFYILSGSFLFTILINLEFILNIVLRDAETRKNTTSLISTYTTSFGNFMNDKIFNPDLVTFILWAILGFSVYLILNFIQNETEEVYETVSFMKKYIHPANYSNKSYVFFILTRIIEIIFISITIIAWIYMIIKVFVPFSNYSMLIATTIDSSVIYTIYNIFMSFISIFVGFLGLYVFIKLLIIYSKSN